MQSRLKPTRCTGPARRGFTLLESLIAAAILMGIVLAVTSAVIAGQQSAFEAHQRVAAALAAEAMMNRLSTIDYSRLANYNGATEAVGEMLDENGMPMPDTFGAIGRRVVVASTYKTVSPPTATIYGRTARVDTFDASGRVLASIERFFTEPPSSS